MTTPHPHADILKAWAEDVDLEIQWRRKGDKGSPSKWSSKISVQEAYEDHVVNNAFDIRVASDWRNKFRDALERGEEVEFKGHTGAWRVPQRYEGVLTFTYQETDYRLKPKPLECWVNVYDQGDFISYPTAEAARGADRNGAPVRVAIKMCEVTKE